MLHVRRSHARGARKEKTSPLSPSLLLLPRDLAVEPQLEPVAERPHVGVLVLHHLEGVGHHLDVPYADRRAAAGLEAQVEVARVLGVDAEHVDGPVRVGVRIRRQPAFCMTCR